MPGFQIIEHINLFQICFATSCAQAIVAKQLNVLEPQACMPGLYVLRTYRPGLSLLKGSIAM